VFLLNRVPCNLPEALSAKAESGWTTCSYVPPTIRTSKAELHRMGEKAVKELYVLYAFSKGRLKAFDLFPCGSVHQWRHVN
jgi:hypothetical protein